MYIDLSHFSVYTSASFLLSIQVSLCIYNIPEWGVGNICPPPPLNDFDAGEYFQRGCQFLGWFINFLRFSVSFGLIYQPLPSSDLNIFTDFDSIYTISSGPHINKNIVNLINRRKEEKGDSSVLKPVSYRKVQLLNNVSAKRGNFCISCFLKRENADGISLNGWHFY